MPYELIPGRMYRMPTHFGPANGPRQDPNGNRYDWSDMEVTWVTLVLAGSADAIDAVLPAGFSVLPEPVVEVSFGYMRNLPWLAGRGYNTLGVSVPVRYERSVGKPSGSLLLVLWENLADPIITGREELGVSKIYCELPDLKRAGGELYCEASWLGYRFFELRARALHEGTAPPARSIELTEGRLLHHKYQPRTQVWGSAEVDQVTLTPPVKGGTVLRSEIGIGKYSWGRPTWQDMPTQHNIVDGVRSIASGEVLSCSVSEVRGAISDHRDQRIVE